MPKAEAAEAAIVLLNKDSSKRLIITNDGQVEIKTGEYVPRNKVQFPPKLSFSGANPNKKYIIIGLDLDPPFPSFSFLGPALHWIQTGLTIAAADQATGLLSVVGPSDNDTAGATTTTTTTTATVVPPLASYHPPRPPPGSSPHRYVFLLYEQPEDFDRQVDRKPIGLSDRPRFDYNGFLERTGLGEVVAVNYYLSK